MTTQAGAPKSRRYLKPEFGRPGGSSVLGGAQMASHLRHDR